MTAASKDDKRRSVPPRGMAMVRARVGRGREVDMGTPGRSCVGVGGRRGRVWPVVEVAYAWGRFAATALRSLDHRSDFYRL